MPPFSDCAICLARFAVDDGWPFAECPTCRYGAAHNHFVRTGESVALDDAALEAPRPLSFSEIGEANWRTGFPIVTSPHMPRDRAMIVHGEIVVHPESLRALQDADVLPRQRPTGDPVRADIYADTSSLARSFESVSASLARLGESFGSAARAASIAGTSMAQAYSALIPGDGAGLPDDDVLVAYVDELRRTRVFDPAAQAPEPEAEPTPIGGRRALALSGTIGAKR